jgi:hypothetical protein
LRDSNKSYRAFIWWMEKPIKHLFVFTPSIGVKYFLVDLNGMTCFCAYSQCRSSAILGGLYVILILKHDKSLIGVNKA